MKDTVGLVSRPRRMMTQGSREPPNMQEANGSIKALTLWPSALHSRELDTDTAALTFPTTVSDPLYSFYHFSSLQRKTEVPMTTEKADMAY